MKNKIKTPIARFTIEQLQEWKAEGGYVSKMYMLYIKKGKVESLCGFNCDEKGFRDMLKRIEEELKC